MEEKNFSHDAEYQQTEKVETIKAKPAGFKLSNIQIIVFIAALIVLVSGGYFLFKGKFVDRYMSPQLRQMQQTVTKVRDLETDIQEKQNEMFSLMKDYKEETGKDLPPLKLLDLSEEERMILEEKIRNEQDVSLKAMLNDLLDKNKEIGELKSELEKLEKLLPAPHMVQAGENHYQLAMDYLLNEKGVEKKKAMELIERALLFDPLVPGFKVWNFYSGDEYGTFITQGSAAVSPNAVRRKSKKKLVDARDKAVSERDKLARDIEALESRRGQLISQLELLNNEKGKLITQISNLNKDNLEMQEVINSLFYLADLKKNLKKRGIIKGGFLRSPKLRAVSPEYFAHSIDMRTRDTIVFSAADFNLKKIKNLLLYPKYYKKGKEYKVIIAKDKQEAELTILDITKLKNERVVISIE
ncbi:MAG: hypothetical protein KAW12_28430 [Candidatus Aminicenantes bacterium]|nr:hypothetical protein [Candidatus Aminicenantes bacterium]